jgi:hypothetical protein
MAFLSNKSLFAKSIVDSIKLSTRLFQAGMREDGLEMCKIKRLDGMSNKTRSTLFLEDT